MRMSRVERLQCHIGNGEPRGAEPPSLSEKLDRSTLCPSPSSQVRPSRPSKLIAMASIELAATYAALILADDGIEITSDKILALTTAASVELEPIWANLLAKALEGKNVKELLSNVGAGGAGPAVAPAAGGAAAAAADAPKEEEKKEEEKEESDDDMGFGLFD
ncbi:60s acidic ribosomal protein-domain-containing protein [Ganoderma leucocontextum]|nr:60s acidic ribosomal protein-domain-containing protein [Ganoderma leucocontextum]